MNLDIKVWHKTKKVWIENFIVSQSGKVYETSQVGDSVSFDKLHLESGYFDNLAVEDITDTVEISRFIGRVDKDEVKIYSGSIIEHYASLCFTPSEVEELNGEFPKTKITDVVNIPYCYLEEANSMFQFSFKDSKVIGNIFENPELLKS